MPQMARIPSPLSMTRLSPPLLLLLLLAFHIFLAEVRRCGHRMSKSFMRCSECIVHHNWHQEGDWKKNFIRIVTGDFMDVPRKLAKSIREQISNKVKLEVSDGNKYTVQVSKDENGLVFQSGWATFASTYELEQGDILLFESSGSSCFEIRIFNQSCCEKELSCVAMNNTPCLHERNMSHENDMQSPKNERCGSMRSKCRTKCKECAEFYYWHRMDKMRFFIVMMGVGASKDGLTIPKKFANNVREQLSEEIMLEVPDGQTYSVQIAKEQHELVLRSGWDTFARAYELEEGDILLFGYSGNSQFKVRIFNVSGCDKLLSCVVKNITPCVQERSACHDNPTQSPRGRTGPNGHRMNESCTICLESVRHHYWHMDDHDWCFFKVMCLRNFKDEMAIPKEFTANFRGHISDEINLEVPDGKIYNVQVAKEHDELVLRSGWTKFADAYELELCDFLVFTYSGNSHFKVRILKKSGCEKELSCVMMNCGPNVQKSVIVHDQSLPTKRKRQDDGSNHNRKTSKMTPAHSPSQKSNLKLNTEDVTCSEDIQDPRSSGGLQGSTKSRYILEMGCKLTSVQEARVNQLVTESRTGIPFYVTAMNKKSLSDGFQVICKDYAVNHLPHEDQTIKLCHPQNSKTWDASLKVITDGTCTLSSILTTGWLGFVRDNKLQEGDICALEVSKSDGRVTITVHHLTESPRPEYVATGHTKSTHQQKKKVTHRGYVATQNTKLTREQEKKIEERLQVIQPEIEIFVSPIRSYRASVYFKQSYADDHLPREDQTMRLRRPGKKRTWRVELQIGDKEKGKFYELKKGWRKFVHKNKLQEGDMCLFELLKNEEEPTMNVYIIRGE